MPDQPSEKQPTPPVASTPAEHRKTVQEYAEEYQRLADSQLPVCLGFSARFNMLWDLAGAAPPQIEGRVLSIDGKRHHGNQQRLAGVRCAQLAAEGCPAVEA